ncbi:GEVED domain-containing protein [Flavobacterium humi]|uniref:T9SS type A sorting domain-containing protein n=1 Tax=Flavobacterium humi TaxID=2562683 RepID=A0A4Z0L9H7_9FLAO|nr:GEVED domain-containing protein [Flavobacterium humi]TGD58451.1 T9SS type A sorting domain-containing protein [Flavobacterium humi]
MKKLFLGLSILACSYLQAQTDKFWSMHQDQASKMVTDKGVARASFPKEFKLFDLNIDPLRQALFSTQNRASKMIITLPNADGGLEQFEMSEASNFEPALQAQFPQIRAYSGKGITDKYATLKLSISQEGIQTMVFRTDKENEFIEPYSQDHKTYAVFRSHRDKGKLPWTCSTDDHNMVTDINAQLPGANKSSTGQLKTMRLAQSCNGEYAAYFGASTAGNATDQGKVLAAFNATLTRCNGVYEKDLALHLNLIANTTAVIYYNASTDPYSTTLSQWNAQLQTTLTNNIGEANYDIGHMFGASGGGGNAGCIGCVCVNGQKGSGITSPADGIPQGDNFDIDYVVHEVGHQLGGNHTFSNSNEGSGVSKEVGSGVTIMGYAGITSQDIAPHSIDIYHETTIAQIQANLATKSCPVTTSLAGTNATPVVSAGADYTIPKSTPFMLTGSATDANTGDALTYVWEQNDDGGSQTGANSVASVGKTSGPNWRSWSPTASPTRYFPILQTVLAGGQTTAGTGNDGINVEALSSVARTLNFRLTVRDNSPYSSVAPIKVGQTAFDDMVVTVNATAGPFSVSAPNTAVSYVGGSSQNITWNVAGTTANGVNCANVDILLSTDGGNTFPVTLLAGTPNDGTQAVTIPNTPGTTNRIMVKGSGHIFFDISNANFTITTGTIDNTPPSAPTSLAASGTTQTTTNLSWTASTDNVGVTGYDVYQDGVFKANVATTSYAVTGLTASTAYSFYVIARDAAGNSSTASNTVNVTTSAPIIDTTPPSAPTSLAASGTTSSSTNLSWTASTDNVGVTGYDVYQGGVFKANVATTSYTVTGLTASTAYSFYVIARDAAGNSSTASNTVNVTTSPITITYCASQGNNVADELIGRVQIGTINNASTGGTGYTDFTSISTNLTKGASTTITVTPTWTGSSYPEAYAVFIDYNQDGDFTDSGELVWSKAASTTTPATGTFTVSSSATTGPTRMRVSMKYNGIPTACETFSYGQVEDYTVNLQGGGLPTYCASQASNTNDERIGKVVFNTINNTSTGTAGYENFTAQSTNAGRGATYTITVTPTWTGSTYPEAYAVFIDYNQDGDFTDSGELAWSAAASTTTPVSGSITIPAAATLGATRMRVSMKYNGIPTACEAFTYGQVEDYTVNISTTARPDAVENNLSSIKLYPNPTEGILNITEVSENAAFRVFNLIGQTVLSGKIVNGSIDVAKMESGNYILEVSDNNGVITKRFIKK